MTTLTAFTYSKRYTPILNLLEYVKAVKAVTPEILKYKWDAWSQAVPWQKATTQRPATQRPTTQRPATQRPATEEAGV